MKNGLVTSADECKTEVSNQLTLKTSQSVTKPTESSLYKLSRYTSQTKLYD